MVDLFANSGDPDQTSRSAASDLGLHCLPVIRLGVFSLQWVKKKFCNEKRSSNIKYFLLISKCCSLRIEFAPPPPPPTTPHLSTPGSKFFPLRKAPIVESTLGRFFSRFLLRVRKIISSMSLTMLKCICLDRHGQFLDTYMDSIKIYSWRTADALMILIYVHNSRLGIHGSHMYDGRFRYDATPVTY